MITVETLYRDDVADKIISISGGKELRGPCPACGGTDRFGVWPQQNKGMGSFYCGRGRMGGHGCGLGGDAIEYLRRFRNMSYKQACGYLGIEEKGTGGNHYRYDTPRMPRQYRESATRFRPETKGFPEEVVDPRMWHEHGMKFVNNCHEALLQRPMAIAYLMARGISRKSIEKYRLGFHYGETRNGKEFAPSFRPWPSWGLKAEKKPGTDKHRMIVLPAGIVIPSIIDGFLRGITIRLIKPDPQSPKKKYHYVRGGVRDTWLSNPHARAFVLQEAMLDCIAVDDAAGDLVGTIGLGTTDAKPDARATKALKGATIILGALDFDTPRINERTGKEEAPGRDASEWWKKQYGQFRRFPVPVGKDAGEAFQEGVDLREWVLLGLPASIKGAAALKQPVAVEPAHEPQPVPIASEFKQLLGESKGYVRVYDQGAGLGLDIPPEWSAQHQEKRRRLSDLLFSDELAYVVGNLADGLYEASNLPG